MKQKQLLLDKNSHTLSGQNLQVDAKDDLTQQNISITSKYNLFIHCYNKECNRIDQRTLSYIPESKIMDKVYQGLVKTKILILIIVFQLIPFFNVFILVFVLYSVSFYFKGLRVYHKNEVKVRDPFKRMRFDRQKCLRLKKNYHFFKLNFKSLKQAFNIRQNYNLTQQLGKQGQQSQWMIYNQQFQSYYTYFPKLATKIYILISISVLLVLLSNVIFIAFVF